MASLAIVSIAHTKVPLGLEMLAEILRILELGQLEVGSGYAVVAYPN